MCELFAMSARYPTNVSLSFRELARHGGETGPHADGWGIAYYQEHDAHLLREPEAASNSDWIDFIRHKAIQSHIVISHIRLATKGTNQLSNTHPFRRELGGRLHTFAHNGQFEGIFDNLQFALGHNRPIGDTDSEWAFCALLHRLEEAWSGDTPPTLQIRKEIITQFASELRPLGPANFIYSDGEYLYAHGHKRTQRDGTRRPPGLHVLCRICLKKEKLPDLVGVHLKEGDEQIATLIASVPLSDEDWRPLEEGELLVLQNGEVAQS